MNDDQRTTAKFKIHVGYIEVEAALQQHYSASIQTRALHIDLARTGRITPLALCLLYGWAYDVWSSDGTVTLVAPRGGNQATSLFASAALKSKIEKDSRIVNVAYGDRMGAGARYLSAFEVFEKAEGLDSYLQSLSSASGRRAVLRAAEDYPLLSSGDMRDVLLRELIGNSFVHADCSGSHYCAYGYETSGKQPGSILAAFPKPAISAVYQPGLFPGVERKMARISGRPGYLETCIADSCSTNLYETLKQAHIDPNPEFPYWVDKSTRLTSHDLMVLHAFNFASTSDEEKRADRVHKYIAGWDPDMMSVSTIATGLYRVRRVAELYFGQIVIRTDRRIGTIDYSRDSLKKGAPRVAFQHRLNGSPLAALRGTFISVRAPVDKTALGQRVMQSAASAPSEDHRPFSSVVSVGPFAPGEQEKHLSSASILVEIERQVRNALEQAEETDLVVAVLDGITGYAGITRNPIAALIDLLSQIPRKAALAVVFDNSELVEEVAEAYKRLKGVLEASPIDLRTSLILCGPYAEAIRGYGETNRPEATYVSDSLIRSVGGREIPAADVPSRARKQWLARVISSPFVREASQGYLYLDRSARVYFRKYFDIARIASSQATMTTLRSWLIGELRERKPAVVAVNSPFLLSQALAATSEMLNPIPCLMFSDSGILPLAAECRESCGENGRLLVLVDVLTEVDQALPKFLEAFLEPSRCDLIAVADGRDDPGLPLQVRDGSGYMQLPVFSLVQETLGLVENRGATSATQVIRIDPSSHSLVKYAYSRTGDQSHDEEREKEIRKGLELLDIAEDANALHVGHFEFRGRHYDRLFELRRLFNYIQEDILTWIGGSEVDDIVKSRISLDELDVYCLDEGTELFEILERSLAKCGVSSIRYLPNPERDLMEIPRAQDGRPMWFILPIHSEGHMLTRCLEFAAGARAKYVRVSTIIDRASPGRQSLVEGVNSFRGMEIRFSRMYSIPLGLSRGPCGICAIEADLRVAARATRENLPHLHSIIDSARHSLCAIPIMNAGDSRGIEDGKDSSSLASEFAARSLYERAAAGDVQANWLLGERLAKPGGYDALARAASTGPEHLFDYATAIRVLREGNELDDSPGDVGLSTACEKWTEQAASDYDPETFARELRGYALLDRYTLKRNLAGLFTRVMSSPALISELLAHSVTAPYLYIDLLDTSDPDAATEEQVALALRELKKYILNTGSWISILYGLSFHLEHSTAWDLGFRDLRMKALSSPRNLDELRVACDTFSHRGILEANRMVLRLRSEGFWRSLPGRKEIELLWDGVFSVAVNLVETIP